MENNFFIVLIMSQYDSYFILIFLSQIMHLFLA